MARRKNYSINRYTGKRDYYYPKYSSSGRGTSGGGDVGVSMRRAGGGGRRRGGSAFDNSDSRYAWKRFMRGMGDTGQGYSEDIGTGDYAPGDQEGQELNLYDMMALMDAMNTPTAEDEAWNAPIPEEDLAIPANAVRTAGLNTRDIASDAPSGISIPALQTSYREALMPAPVESTPKAKQPLSPEALGQKPEPQKPPVKTVPTYEDTALPGTLNALRGVGFKSEGLGPWTGPTNRGPEMPWRGANEDAFDAVREAVLAEGPMPFWGGPRPGTPPPSMFANIVGDQVREMYPYGVEAEPNVQYPERVTSPGRGNVVSYDKKTGTRTELADQDMGGVWRQGADKKWIGGVPANDLYAQTTRALQDYLTTPKPIISPNEYNKQREYTGRFPEEPELPFSGTNMFGTTPTPAPQRLPFEPEPIVPVGKQSARDNILGMLMREAAPQIMFGGMEAQTGELPQLAWRDNQEEQRRREEERRRQEEMMRQQGGRDTGLGGLGGRGEFGGLGRLGGFGGSSSPLASLASYGGLGALWE